MIAVYTVGSKIWILELHNLEKKINCKYIFKVNIVIRYMAYKICYLVIKKESKKRVLLKCVIQNWSLHNTINYWNAQGYENKMTKQSQNQITANTNFYTTTHLLTNIKIKKIDFLK